jgi:membrane-associated phospholipid phosphatase
MRHFIRARFSREGILGRHLTAGAFLISVAFLLFAGLANEVMSAAPITVFDLHAINWMRAHSTPGLTSLMLLITHIHSTPGLLVLALLTCVWLFRRKEWSWIVPVGMTINALLKLMFQRARPVFEQPVLTLTTYSFPSGHAAGATLFYGVLAAYLFCRITSWRLRILIILLATAQVAAVCLSRVYLGVHYPTDVLAGIVEGVAWLTVILTVIATLRRWRMLRASAG